jgi:hypothetical protein
MTSLTVHATEVSAAFVTWAVNCWVPPSWTTAVGGVTMTWASGLTPIATVALPDFVESAVDTAEMVTFGDVGTVAGAVYRPLGEIAPTVAFPPATPFTFQATAALEAFATATLNCWVALHHKDATAGLTVTVSAPAVTVTDEAPAFVGSAFDTADTLTPAGVGSVLGAE